MLDNFYIYSDFPCGVVAEPQEDAVFFKDLGFNQFVEARLNLQLANY